MKTPEQLREYAIWILGNLVHYQDRKSNYQRDIDFLVVELNKLQNQ